MTPHQLPQRPNLDHLKHGRCCCAPRNAGRRALRRFAILPAHADKTIDPTHCASRRAIGDRARYGFPSWNALREEAEARSLRSTPPRTSSSVPPPAAPRPRERLLALHPGIAHASIYTEITLADVTAVEARLREHPDLATAAGGAQQWAPLLYACHTCLAQTPERKNALVEIARRLCALGADPNGEYHWNWHPELPRTVLWGALCAVRHLPLAEALLQAGANPTDGVSTHIAGGGSNVAALDLLGRYGVNVNGIPGGLPPLVYMMEWAVDPAGPFWLLEHGADPNLAWGAAGDAPLHVAARRWDVPMVDRLVAHGADYAKRRADGATPHTGGLARNHDIATWLLAHGATDELAGGTVHCRVRAPSRWRRRMLARPSCDRNCGPTTT